MKRGLGIVVEENLFRTILIKKRGQGAYRESLLKNKNAQFFLVAAIIIAAVLIGLGKINNYLLVTSKPVVRNEIKDTLERESKGAVDYAISTNKNITETLENLSKSYVSYARSKFPDSQYFFLSVDTDDVALFAFGDITKIRATMVTDFVFTSGGGGDYWRASQNRTGNQINVTFYNQQYTLNFAQRDFQHVARIVDENGIFVSS